MQQQTLSKVLLVIVCFFLSCANVHSQTDFFEISLLAHNTTACAKWGEFQIILGGNNGQLFVWDLETNEQFFFHAQSGVQLATVTALAKIPTAEKILAAFSDGSIIFFQKKEQKLVFDGYLVFPNTQHGVVHTIKLSPSGEKALMYYNVSDKQYKNYNQRSILKIWDLRRAQMVKKFNEPVKNNLHDFVTDDLVIEIDSLGLICQYNLRQGKTTFLTDIALVNVASLAVEQNSKNLIVTTHDGDSYSYELEDSEKVNYIGKISFFFESIDKIALNFKNENGLLEGFLVGFNNQGGEIVFCDVQNKKQFPFSMNYFAKNIVILNSKTFLVLLENGKIFSYVYQSQDDVESVTDAIQGLRLYDNGTRLPIFRSLQS